MKSKVFPNTARIVAYPNTEHDTEVLMFLQNLVDEATGLRAWWTHDHDLENSDGLNDRALVLQR